MRLVIQEFHSTEPAVTVEPYQWTVSGHDATVAFCLRIFQDRLASLEPLRLWDVLRAFADAVDFGVRERQPIAWPITVGIVRPDYIGLTRIGRDEF